MFRQYRRHLLQGNVQPINGILPLSSLPAGKTGILVEIKGGKEFMSRMISLGFSPGIEVSVLQNHAHGPVLASVRESRLALGRSEAQKILLQVNHDDNAHPHHS